jgi:hypothetical protein
MSDSWTRTRSLSPDVRVARLSSESLSGSFTGKINFSLVVSGSQADSSLSLRLSNLSLSAATALSFLRLSLFYLSKEPLSFSVSNQSLTGAIRVRRSPPHLSESKNSLSFSSSVSESSLG